MSDLNTYLAQTRRIRSKLDAARKCDPNLAVFGSQKHKYDIGPPLDRDTLTQFESHHSITLPDAFAAFLTQVGHGAIDTPAPSAGPFYGITPLTMPRPAFGDPSALTNPTVIHPEMSDTDWAKLTEWFQGDHDTLSDPDYDARSDQETAKIYGGLLKLGFQGCQSYHALVLNGPHSGRVVNLDTDGHKPQFTKDKNFLVWYERWLDDVLSGTLQNPQAGWFGYDSGASS